MKETWLPVRGYEGLYEVSNMGRVKGCANRPQFHLVSGDVIKKPKLDHEGYVWVFLSKKSKKLRFKVARLVASHFLPVPTPDRNEINHIDGVKTNDAVSNLEWCSRKENARHASINKLLAFGDRNGSRIHPERLKRGESHPTSKLTDKQVIAMKKLMKSGSKDAELVLRFGVRQPTVSCIRHGRNWRHIQI